MRRGAAGGVSRQASPERLNLARRTLKNVQSAAAVYGLFVYSGVAPSAETCGTANRNPVNQRDEVLFRNAGCVARVEALMLEQNVAAQKCCGALTPQKTLTNKPEYESRQTSEDN